MSKKDQSEAKRVQRPGQIETEFFFVFFLLITVGWIIWHLPAVGTAAAAEIKTGDRARTYEEVTVRSLNEGVDKDCRLGFGAELEAVGSHQTQVLLRNLSSGELKTEGCPKGTLFFTDALWFQGTFHQYDLEFERRQKLYAQAEERHKIVRDLLAAEELIKH